MREDARLSGRALAAVMSWHFTKVSKIENGSRSPSEEDIRTWCSACGAADQITGFLGQTGHTLDPPPL
jgi:transcriptional regulator with XRE-family HTH domain